jgi:hypothetical protein
MMKYYKNDEGNVWAYEDGRPTPSGMTEVTLEEVKTYITPVKSPEEKLAERRAAVDAHIDSVAKSAGLYGFTSILSAVSYADDIADTVNQPVGYALREWRRECLAVCRTMLGEWLGGGDEPSVEEVIAALPEFIEP